MFQRLRSCLVVSALLSALAVGCGPSGSSGSEPVDPDVPAPATTASAEVPRAWTAEESNIARAAIAQGYLADTTAYWAVHGLPALARGAELLANGPHPNAMFDTVMTAFEPQKFGTSCELGQIHPMICGRALASGDARSGLPDAVRLWVLEGGDLTTRGLTELVTTSFDANALRGLAPAASKTAEVLPSVKKDVVCSQPANDGADAGGPTWENVGYVKELAGGKPDGLCITKAVGLCTQRLGLRGPTVTPEAWQELSTKLGATPEGGGSIDAMKSYFKDNGYAVSEAWDGPRESAAKEAHDALARGCDLFLWYDSGDAQSHIEVVTHVDIENRPDGEAVVTTNSWGKTDATTKFVKGTYSEKSDAAKYGPGWRPSSNATFYYACAE